MNKLFTTLSIALVGLSIGFGASSANAAGKGFLDVNINIGGGNKNQGNGGNGPVANNNGGRDVANDWAEKRRAKIEADAAQRHIDAKAKAKADLEAQNKANAKPGDKPIKITGSVKTLGDKQVAACQQQVAIQFVNKSGGVTTVDEAKKRQAQCVTMFRD